MITARDIIAHLEQRNGHPLHGDEGVIVGTADAPAPAVLVSWMATAAALSEAGRRGCRVVVAHESVFYPYNARPGDEDSASFMAWPVNRRRADLMARYDLTVVRLHGSMDEAVIYEDFAHRLGLGAPVQGSGYFCVYELPEPVPLGELARRVRRALGMEGLRLAGDPDRPVRRVGLPWGGMGLFVNVGYMQQLADLGLDVMIAGESDEYAMIFTTEQGIPMIETSHTLSENAGVAAYARWLAASFPDLRVEYFETPRPWHIYIPDAE